jgi:hypothetical protein
MWTGDDPCNNWIGVFCYQGIVAVLNLPGYDLNGIISRSMYFV